MKHLSLCLTVLLLGAMPLTAAALDYGPNHPLLAVEDGAPQLPGAQARAASKGAMPKPDVMVEASADDATDPSPAMPRMAPSTSSPSAAAPRSHGPTSSNKPRATTNTKSAVEPGPATWQSLLPGSIQ